MKRNSRRFACSCSAFSVPLLPLPGSRLSGKGAPHRFGGREQRDRGEPACVPLKSTKPTRCGVGIFKIRGKRQAMTLRIDPSVGRVGPSFHLATGITLRRRRHAHQALVWLQLTYTRRFLFPQRLAPLSAPRSLNGESAAGLMLAKICPI